MSAFGSQTGGCAFRLLGLALLMFGGLCGYITFDMPMSEYTVIFLCVAFLLVAAGVTFLWDTRRTKQAADERRSGFTRTSQETAGQLYARAKKIVKNMPNYSGDFESLPGSGWTHIPQNYSVHSERGLPQWWGSVQLFITVAFDPRTGEQWGPVYHLAPAISGPAAYGIDLEDWADPRAFDYDKESSE